VRVEEYRGAIEESLRERLREAEAYGIDHYIWSLREQIAQRLNNVVLVVIDSDAAQLFSIFLDSKINWV